MKRVLFVALIVFAVAGPIITIALMRRLESVQRQPQTLAEKLDALPAEFEKKLPMMMEDEITEWTGIETSSDSITYLYRVTTVAAAEIDTLELINAVKPEVMARACGSDEVTRDFLSQGVSLRYVYHDKNMQQIGFVDVRPSDCGY